VVIQENQGVAKGHQRRTTTMGKKKINEVLIGHVDIIVMRLYEIVARGCYAPFLSGMRLLKSIQI